MKRFLLFVVFITSLSLHAQDFNSFLLNKTLRIDYIFSGNANEQHIALDKLYQQPNWYGKRIRLAIRDRLFIVTPSPLFFRNG